MKKHSFQNKKVKNRFLNKSGMTYVELICALSLLSLIVMMFTPMLLSSYDTLYKAGERVEEVYDSKEQMEQGLAKRDSELTMGFNMNLNVSADIFFQNIKVTGRKVVSSLQESFETAFGQSRASIEIISPTTVHDDSTSHNVTLQTTGLEYQKITFGKFTYSREEDGTTDMPDDQIHIEIIVPNKTKGGGSVSGSGSPGATTDEAVYDGSAGYCKIEYFTSDTTSTEIPSSGINITNRTEGGRIKIKVKSSDVSILDFTYSPLKVKVYYVNPRGKLRTAADYLYIDPPTLMFAGETGANADYYTSAGVQETSETGVDASGEAQKISVYSLALEGRAMRTKNSPYLNNAGSYTGQVFGAPSSEGVEIHSINWIDKDETAGLSPYYIMTGTNGAIYRMYNFTSDQTNIYEYAVGHGIKNTTTGYFSGSQAYIDKTFDLINGKRVHPSLWSGDFSHVFEYESAKKRVAYGKSVNYDKDETWLTSTDRSGLVGADMYNVFSPQSQYAYYYNGDATGHTYNFKNTRPISYILTERGWPMRLYGIVGAKTNILGEDSFSDFTALWDTTNYTIDESESETYTDSRMVHAFHYRTDNSDVQNDYAYSSIRLKSLGSYDVSFTPDGTADYFDTEDDYANATSMAKLATVRRGQGESDKSERLNNEQYKINITDAVYIPSVNNDGKGSTFYVGTVQAFANVIQTDRIDTSYVEGSKNNISSGDRWRYYRHEHGGLFEGYRNECNYLAGAVTDYLFYSTADGSGTYIAKFNDNQAKSRGTDDERKAQLKVMSDYINSLPDKKQPDYGIVTDGSTLANRTAFFLPDQSNVWEYIYLKNVNFSFGYASNRERVYTNITYDGTTEYMRSFERLYWRSHYGQDAYDGASQTAFSGNALAVHTQNRAVNGGSGGLNTGAAYLNSTENDYYNVWFPGEMYNLTNIASKDGITVAVGYSVVGSTYQYAHASNTELTSTALGGVYNDGVLSAMIEGKNSALVNLLYFKDNASFDNHSLSGYSQYSAYGSYGMHTRDSVQFTAVDIIVENVKANETATSGIINYYAIYGDSKGRVYKSLIATAQGNFTTEGESSASQLGAELVPFVKDLSYNGTSGSYTVGGRSIPYSGMEEIRVDYAGEKYTVNTAFSKITSINAYDDLVIISGVPQTGVQESFVVGQLVDGVWSWKWVINGNFGGTIENATIANGYYYFIGYDKTISSSYLAAISLDRLKSISGEVNQNILSNTEGTTRNAEDVIWCRTGSSKKMYAIAGRAV